MGEVIYLRSINNHHCVVDVSSPVTRRSMKWRDSLLFKVIHKEIGNYWADRRSHGSTFTLNIKLLIIHKVRCFQTNLKKVRDLLRVEISPRLKSIIGWQEIFDDGKTFFHWHAGKQCSNIVRHETLIGAKSDFLHFRYQVLTVLQVSIRFANEGRGRILATCLAVS